ncbi:hypothetical protein ACO1GV_05715 [Fusobacterium watanabei]|uniref:hypothetical protein n=1 Tax=Fusobacterium watanabei TaxID=2686067 RepID=UPI003B589535
MIAISHFISSFCNLFLFASIFFVIILTFSVILYQCIKIVGIFLIFLIIDNQNTIFKRKFLFKNFILALVYLFFLSIFLSLNIIGIKYVETILEMEIILKVKEMIIAMIFGIIEIGISYLFVSFWVNKLNLIGKR